MSTGRRGGSDGRLQRPQPRHSIGGEVVLVDGATGTELQRRGVQLDRVAWSGLVPLTHPEVLTAVHADYLRAGAAVVTTSTFATNRFVLAAAGCADRFVDINRAAVEAVRRAFDAAGREAAIAGSISCLPPGFDPAAYPDARSERAAYAELAELLAELGADLLVLEMMEDVVHASRAADAVRAVGLPFWLGVSCRLDARGGLAAYDFPEIPLGDVLDGLLGFAPAAVNVMHTPVDAVPAALAALEARAVDARGVYPEIASNVTPEAFAALGLEWMAAGARILGGCCGTTPAHIAALNDALPRASAPS